jgi:hypothetical protein
MIENLIKCFQSYKTQMEYKNLDFDGDRPAQYTNQREGERNKAIIFTGCCEPNKIWKRKNRV